MNESLRDELPFLRRFARALLGRQGPADSLVAEAIRVIGDGLDGSSPEQARLLLYQALLDARAASLGTASDPPLAATVANEQIVAARLRSMPDEAAIALLLTTLDGLDLTEVAFVMRLDETTAAALLQEAQVVLDRQAASDVLIIEDEPVIAMDIAGIVRQAGHRVLGIATTRSEAVALAERQRPKLILADIKLEDDSSGIAAVDDILGQGALPVVFITAFPERLLDNERIEPSLLITKPFSDHLLRVAIAQALDLAAAPGPAGRPGS
jgi:CheY-like chemotaxis protein